MKKIEKIIENSSLLKLALNNSDETTARGAMVALIGDIIKADGVIIYSKEIPKELETQLNEITEELNNLKAPTDDASAEVANKKLAVAKRLAEKLKAHGLDMRRPANEAADDIIKFERDTLSPITSAIKTVNDFVVSYKTQKLKEANDEAARIKKEAEDAAAAQKLRIEATFSKIGQVRVNMLKGITDASTVEDLEKAEEKINSIKFNPESYKEYLPNVEKVRTDMLELLKNKKEKLIEAQNNLEETGEDSTKAIEEAKEEGSAFLARANYDNSKELQDEKTAALQTIQMKSELRISSIQTPKSVSTPWVYKGVENISLVPAEFFSVDEAKVKAAIKAGRYTIPGLIITQDVRNISR